MGSDIAVKADVCAHVASYISKAKIKFTDR